MDPVTVIALDLGYRATGVAVVEQPGDVVHEWHLVRAEPTSPKKVTEEVRIARAGTATQGLIAVVEAAERYGPCAVIYESPQAWIGGKHRQQKQKTNVQTIMALGAAKERMYYALAQANWQRPVYCLEPSEWQGPFCGVVRRSKKVMKPLVRKYLAMRTGIELEKKYQDVAEAIAIGIVGANLILLRYLDRE